MECTFFTKCSDDMFWADKERVKTLIDLYHAYECLWNVKCAEYKNISKKKTPKSTLGHISDYQVCVCYLEVSLDSFAVVNFSE